MSKLTLLFLLAAFTLPSILLFSQHVAVPQASQESVVKYNDWEGGIFAGYSNYLGDLVPSVITFKDAHPAYGFFLRRRLSYRFGLRGNIFAGKIDGSDLHYDKNRSRGTSFESSLLEVGLTGEYEFRLNRNKGRDLYRTGENGKRIFRKSIVPYMFAGGGIVLFDNNTKYGGTMPALENEDRKAEYAQKKFCIPVGGGVKINLTERMLLGLEWGERFTFTDYLDGVKASGDPNDNDTYVVGGVSLSVRFGRKDQDADGIADNEDRCPTAAGSRALNGCPDRDHDSVPDDSDKCPDIPGQIRLSGCPDQDGDGVADFDDACPGTPGLRRFSGCPDRDDDGIVDNEDICPDVAGLPALNGCPDADRDGVTDSEDRCPSEPGTVELDGCPDTDRDGILDADDQCPYQPGIARFNGCPDSDNDGVEDAKDKCPYAPGLVSLEGCPEEPVVPKGEIKLSNVYFETNSAMLTSVSQSVLDEIVKTMQQYPDRQLYLSGYTDSDGDPDKNKLLSEKRVKACFEYLKNKGINPALMSIVGYGEDQPAEDNSTPDGRQMNRRVEFHLMTQ